MIFTPLCILFLLAYFFFQFYSGTMIYNTANAGISYINGYNTTEYHQTQVATH